MNILLNILRGMLAGGGVWGLAGFAVRTFGDHEPPFAEPQLARLLVGLACVTGSLILRRAGRQRLQHERPGT